MAWAADRFAPRIDVERHAAANAERPIDEGHRFPARCAQSMRLEETGPARHAKRRKQQIEHRTNAMAGGPPGAGGSAGDAYSPLHVHGLTLVWRIPNTHVLWQRSKRNYASKHTH